MITSSLCRPANGFGAVLLVMLAIAPQIAAAKDEVKIKDEYRAGDSAFADIDTIVVYSPHVTTSGRNSRSGDGWRRQTNTEMPPDSMCLELSKEIAKAIRRRDSSIYVLVRLSDDNLTSDSTKAQSARDSVGADAVFIAEVLEAETEGGAPMVVLPWGGGSPGHFARANAKVQFRIVTTSATETLWRITCRTKHEAKGDTAPPVELAIGIAYTAATSKLPF